MATTVLESFLVASVQDSLRLLLYDNAKFLCERLVASYSSESNVCLLALCYYHCNQAYRSYHLLKGHQSPQSRYLLALCCLQLGKMNEARDALAKSGNGQVPNGAAGHFLLGRVSKMVGRPTEAREHFVRALRLNPLLWSAYEELCSLGGDDQAAEICAAAEAAAAAAAETGTSISDSRAPMEAVTFGREAAVGHGPHSISAANAGSVAPFAEFTPNVYNDNSNNTSNNVRFTQQLMSVADNCKTDTAGVHPMYGQHDRNAMVASGLQHGTGAGPLFSEMQWQTPNGAAGFMTPAAPGAGLGASQAAPPSTAVPTFGGSYAMGGMEGGLLYETPLPAAVPSGPPGPPQKAMGQAEGTTNATAAKPGLMDKAVQQYSKAQDQLAPTSMEDGGVTPMCNAARPGHGAAASLAFSGADHHYRPRHARVMDEGKVRKVSGKLFQEPSRRSTRLAAKDLHHYMPESVLGKGATALSHHHCQNQPDPDHPPHAPTHQQAHFDAKIKASGGDTAGGAIQGPQPVGHVRWHLMSNGSGGGGEQQQGHAAQDGLLMAHALLGPVKEGYRHLCMYRCKDALQAFSRLPKQQYNTAWVLCQVGRAHFERMDYHPAAAAFESARKLDPHRVEGMELYSTVLWHMRRDVELSYLVQEMQALDRLAPQSWCVLGNFCSLQKEHESAVEMFQRAMQLDPTFAYAYTLAGHEYFANEAYDKSLACYRNAVRLDPRHYNAMYGVGQIYFRQEKYEMALVHFKSAALINPCSSVLHCCIAMTLHRQGMLDRALGKLQEAIELDPKNPLARFTKASVLTDMEHYDLALAELQQLTQRSPGEPSVYFHMGKVYKKLGDLESAQQHLELALSFNTNGSEATASLIKTAIEKLALNEEEEEDEL